MGITNCTLYYYCPKCNKLVRTSNLDYNNYTDVDSSEGLYFNDDENCSDCTNE